MRVLGLIPARGGSKGVPRKNIQLLAGKPLIQYTIEAALSSSSLSRIIVSTEDGEIAKVSLSYGAEVPFIRPADLAMDTTPTLPVIQHAVQWLEDHGDHFDAVCLLQPTSPFRKSETIDACIKSLETSNADAVITMLRVPAQYNPHWVYLQGEDGYLYISTGDKEPIPRRQNLPLAYHREGSVYIAKRDVIMNFNSLYGEKVIGYFLEDSLTVNIDSVSDWAKAEQIINEMKG
jgi:CMP-N,N'-diacetyllegionaminic acid synthase